MVATKPELRVRSLRACDRASVVAELSAWSPALDIPALLPPQLFQDRPDTSLIAHELDGAVAAVLIGLVPDDPGDVGYIHFVWVSPHLRRRGVARDLYQRVLAAMRAMGATKVEAATAAANRPAVQFHRSLGFEMVDLPAISGPAAVLMTIDLVGPP